MTTSTIKTIAALVFFAMSWGHADMWTSVLFFIAAMLWVAAALREARR